MSRNRAWPEQIRLALLFLVDIGHPVLILSGVIPLICCFDPGRNEKVLLPVFLAGLCMLPFAALIRGSVWKVKRYWQYFLVMAAAVLGAWTFSRLFAAHYMEGAGRLWFPPLYAALVWFYSVDMGLWRRREYERQRARIENDIEWRMNGVLFERPSLIWLVYFVICYLAGLWTYSPVMCSISLFSGMVYLLMALVSSFYRSDAAFIRSRADLTHVPGKRMRRIGEGILLLLICAVMVCAVPAALTARLRPYQDIRKVRIFMNPPEPELPVMEDPMQNAYEWMNELAMDQENFEMPPWVNDVFYVAGTVVLGLILLKIIQAVRERFREFEGAVEENGDLVEHLEEKAPRVRIRRTPFGAGVSEREKVRRRYRRMIRRALKEVPRPSMMPDEIEHLAGTDKTMEGQALHVLYEQKRYGEDEV